MHIHFIQTDKKLNIVMFISWVVDKQLGDRIVFEEEYINRIHHGWSVETGKSQPEGPSVPVGNQARRVSHWNDGP